MLLVVAAPPPVVLTARLPAAVTVAKPFTVRFRAAGKPVVVASGPATAAFPARRTAPGRFAATVRLARGGRWAIAVRTGGRRYRLGSVTARLPAPQPVLFAQPASIAAAADGTLVLAEAAANRIVRVTTAGVVTPLATGITNPYGIAVAPSGDVYATASDTLVRIDASGRVTPVFTVADLGPVTVAPDGRVYVATSTDVFRIDPATGGVRLTSPAPAPAAVPATAGRLRARRSTIRTRCSSLLTAPSSSRTRTTTASAGSTPSRT